MTYAEYIAALLTVTATVFVFGTAAHFTMQIIHNANDARMERTYAD